MSLVLFLAKKQDWTDLDEGAARNKSIGWGNMSEGSRKEWVLPNTPLPLPSEYLMTHPDELRWSGSAGAVVVMAQRLRSVQRADQRTVWQHGHPHDTSSLKPRQPMPASSSTW